MIETWLMWLLTKLLEILVGKATDAINKAVSDMKRDKERGEVNEANVKAYQDAVDRKSRIDAATSLLNGAALSGRHDN